MLGQSEIVFKADMSHMRVLFALNFGKSLDYQAFSSCSLCIGTKNACQRVLLSVSRGVESALCAFFSHKSPILEHEIFVTTCTDPLPSVGIICILAHTVRTISIFAAVIQLRW